MHLQWKFATDQESWWSAIYWAVFFVNLLIAFMFITTTELITWKITNFFFWFFYFFFFFINAFTAPNHEKYGNFYLYFLIAVNICIGYWAHWCVVLGHFQINNFTGWQKSGNWLRCMDKICKYNKRLFLFQTVTVQRSERLKSFATFVERSLKNHKILLVDI